MSDRESVVRRGIEIWNHGDSEVAAPAEIFDPEIEIVSRMAKLSGAPYRGHDGVRRWMRDADESFEHYRVTLEELAEERGDLVLGFGTVVWRGRGSEVEMEDEIAWVWRFHAEKLLHMTTFDDRDEARRAFEEADQASVGSGSS